MRFVLRAGCWALYYCCAQFLPPSYRPGGVLWRNARVCLARGLLAHAGRGINLESRVDFGSGRLLSMGDHAGIGRDSHVGDLTVGAGTMIGPQFLALSTNHVFETPGVWIRSQGSAASRPISIGEGAWIGARVTVLPGVHIGDFAVVGAGSVVTRDVPDYAVAAGNPARVLRHWPAADSPHEDADAHGATEH